MRRLSTSTVAVLAGLLLAGSAQAVSVTLSTETSDATPASQLDAIVTFEVGEFDGGNLGDELRITLHNPTVGEGGDALFNLSEVFWNSSASVTNLTLLSATHSVNGDVMGLWDPVLANMLADGFDTFDWQLMDGVGAPSLGIVMPGEDVVFILDIDGVGPIDANDFLQQGTLGFLVSVKFVNGPGDDSAWGAIVPEPHTALLVGLGLLGLGFRGRRRR